MKNLIIDKFEEYCNLLDEGCPVILLTALKLLKEQPEVVYCKDCKHYSDNRCMMGNNPTGDWWFCADGRRKG